jgi:hypothetical protein
MTTLTKRGFLAATAAAIAFTAVNANAYDRHDRSFHLMNDSNRTVYSVYATHIDSGTWGPDLLGDSIVHPGRSMFVDPERVRGWRHQGYCRFDVRIVYDRANGPTQTIPNVNLCDLQELVTYGFDRNRVPYTLIYL